MFLIKEIKEKIIYYDKSKSSFFSRHFIFSLTIFPSIMRILASESLEILEAIQSKHLQQY